MNKACCLKSILNLQTQFFFACVSYQKTNIKDNEIPDSIIKKIRNIITFSLINIYNLIISFSRQRLALVTDEKKDNTFLRKQKSYYVSRIKFKMSEIMSGELVRLKKRLKKIESQNAKINDDLQLLKLQGSQTYRAKKVY